jgi:4-amino-4-deoxy-L-arabinose transferase-like glycosyltransferase
MRKQTLSLTLVLLLAICLRFYQLGSVPYGMAWDEAAIGYNGFAIFTTRRDEWLEKLPASFRSFGDYKAPLAIYQSGVFTALFGMNLFAVRLPFALHGVLAVLAIYLLFSEIFARDKNRDKWALLAAFLLAISPWHLHYSRLAFESGMALNLMLWSLYFFYRYLRLPKLANLLLSVALGAATIYTYHSSKLTVPLLFIFLLIAYWPILRNRLHQLGWAALAGALLLVPFLFDAFFAAGLTRANSTIFANHSGLLAMAMAFLQNLLSYFSLDFLTLGKNMGNFRHGDGRFGVLEPISLVLIIVYFFWRQKEKTLLSLALIMTILGFLPAIISEGAASSNRSLLALPGVILLVTLGFRAIWQTLNGHRKLFSILVLGAYLTVTVFYQRSYYQNYPLRSSDDFVDGYLQVFNYLKQTDRSSIDQIVFTTDYQHPYIYALFAFQVSPIAYQGGILNLFFFAEEINESDLLRPNAIVVASKFDQMGEREPDQIIQGSDGQGRFFIYLPE